MDEEPTYEDIAKVFTTTAGTVEGNTWTFDVPPYPINDTTPIGAACDAMHLSAEDRTAVLSLVGVRTLGDLRVVLGRGEVEEKLEKKLRQVLG